MSAEAIKIDDLIFEYPDCMVCADGSEMNYDGGWHCRNCGASWGRDGEEGTVDCDRCGISTNKFVRVGVEQVCGLDCPGRDDAEAVAR